MATYNSAQAFFGLTSVPTPEKQNSNLQGSGGITQQTLSIGAKPIYCAGIEFGKVGESVTLNPLTGVLSGGSAASAASATTSITVNPANNYTITIGGTVYTFKTSAAGAGQVPIGASAEDTRDNLIVEINGSGFGPADANVTASGGSGASITFEANEAGAAGNNIEISVSAESSWTPVPESLTGGSDGVVYPTYEGDGKDLEGITLPTSDDNPGFLMTVSAGRVKATDGTDFSVKPGAVSTTIPGVALLVSDAIGFDGNITISCVEMPASGVAAITLNLLLEPT